MERLKLQLQNKIEELLEEIKKDTTYQRYKNAKEQMKQNREVMTLIKKIKQNQKEMVLKQSKNEDISLLEKENEQSLKILEKIPIYQEFMYLQQDLEEMFHDIEFFIEQILNEEE